MSDKYFRKIQNLSNTELIEVLEENDYHFKEILTDIGVTGKEFLDLGELQVKRWMCDTDQKKKIWSCITQLKSNPDKFLPSSTLEGKYCSVLNRKPALLPKPPNKFTAELEAKLFKKPINVELKQSNTLPRPPNMLPTESFSFPHAEDLTNNECDFYDAEEYLRPIALPPKNNLHKSSTKGENVSKRKPEVMPRDSTDDLGYILGPTTLPRAHKPSTFIGASVQGLDAPIFYEELETSMYEAPPRSDNISIPKNRSPSPEISSSSSSPSPFERTGSGPKMFNIFRQTSFTKQNKATEIADIQAKTKKEWTVMVNRPLPPVPKILTEAESSEENVYCNNKIVSNATAKQARFLQENQISGSDDSLDLLPHYSSESKNCSKLSLPESLLNYDKESHMTSCESLDTLHPDLNFNNYRFYRNTDRKGAKRLLSNLPDGTFLLRPSQKFFLGLTIKYQDRYVNLGVEQHNSLYKLSGNDNESPQFNTVSALIDYFTINTLTFIHQKEVIGLVLQKALPDDIF